MRTFTSAPAVRATLPLILGVAGPTGSGKTFSALRLATGMQRVTGGDIFLIDTEAKRATAYDRFFKFQHVDFAPPFGPLDYMAAIDHCLKQGARNIVIDSMTHEHSGEGGVMDQIEAFLDKRAGNDFSAREKLNMLAHKQPKADRKALNNFIIQAGRGGVNFIFCYRADDKVKPVRGEGIVHMGMTPETTSKLVYEMMAMFLLSAAADGRPISKPDTPLEKMFTKLPVQFRDMLVDGEPLSENLGQKLAEWAKGSDAAKPAPVIPLADLPGGWENWSLEMRGENRAHKGRAALEAWWGTLSAGDKKTLKTRLDRDWKPIADAVPAESQTALAV